MKRLIIFVSALLFAACSSPIDEVVDTQGKAFDLVDASMRATCSCFYEEEGFDSPDECQEELGYSPAQRADYLDCVRDSIESLDSEPPNKLLEAMSCYRDAYDDTERCFRTAELEVRYGRMQCSDMEAQIDECLDEWDKAVPRCLRTMDDEAHAWWEEMNLNLLYDGCLELLDWLY